MPRLTPERYAALRQRRSEDIGMLLDEVDALRAELAAMREKEVALYDKVRRTMNSAIGQLKEHQKTAPAESPPRMFLTCAIQDLEDLLDIVMGRKDLKA